MNEINPFSNVTPIGANRIIQPNDNHPANNTIVRKLDMARRAVLYGVFAEYPDSYSSSLRHNALIFLRSLPEGDVTEPDFDQLIEATRMLARIIEARS